MNRRFAIVGLAAMLVTAVLTHPASAETKLATLKVKGMVCQA